MKTIQAKCIKPNEKDLRVRVQDAPHITAARAHYWRAVDALRKFGTEDEDFVLAPMTFDIFEAKTMEKIGSASEKGFVWEQALLKKSMPRVDITQLRRETLRSSRQPRRQ